MPVTAIQPGAAAPSASRSGTGSLSLKTAVLFVVAITIWRIVMLAFNRTDLFVDEAQYWLWSENLDFGYYSKPPMIGWVIRLFTTIGQSHSSFWIRLPAPLFHMATALLLIPIAKRTVGSEAGPWPAVTFATLPAVSLSSVLMSTDTIQLTFVASAILLFLRLTEKVSAPTAAGLGLALGLAFMTKYSVLFLLPGVAAAMLLLPRARIGWRDALIAASVGAFVVLPNLWWNVLHDGITIQHTESIANWNTQEGKRGLRAAAAIEFLAAQFAVVGPIVFAALLMAIPRMVRGSRGSSPEDTGLNLLAWLSLPCVALLTAQAFFGGANANWAVPAYVAGTVLATRILLSLPRPVMRSSLIINTLTAIAIPVLTVFPQAIKLPGGQPAMKRFIGRSDISEFAGEMARETNIPVIVADNRPILGDLFYTLRGQGLSIYARPVVGGPRNYYEQIFPLPRAQTDPVLYLSESALECEGQAAEEVGRLDVKTGYRAGHTVHAYSVPATCLLPGGSSASLGAARSAAAP